MVIYTLFVLGFFFATVVADDDTGIIGGHNAPESGIPYQVSLRDERNQHHCAGSILNKRWIITAAHCAEENGYSTSVLAGTNSVSKGGEVYKVIKKVNHEKFETDYILQNDIALLKVDRDVEFNDRVQPIKLPEHDTNEETNGMISGWGIINLEEGRLPDHLQVLNVTVLTLTKCLEIWNNENTYPIKESQICTFAKVGKGACGFDSGGPVVANDRLVGVISWGIYCAVGKPDVSTRVFYYLDWINKYITEN